MHFRTSFWDVLSCIWKWTGQVDMAGKQAEGSSRRPEMLCWSLRLYHSAKLMVFSCPEFWEKDPAEVLLWGRGGGWDKGDLSFRAVLLWSVLVKFSLSKGLKQRYFCWMNEGMHGLKTGATDHMELLEGCKWEKEDEKAVDWSLGVVLWGSDEGSRCTYYSFPIFLSICQWARKPKGADTVEKSLRGSQTVASNEAVFDWDTYPGSSNGTSAGWLLF